MSWIFKTGYTTFELDAATAGNAGVLTVLKDLGVDIIRVVPKNIINDALPTLLGKGYKNPSIMRIDAPEAFSCSSFISYLFTLGGYWQPSISVDKYAFGTPITREELEWGDLVFSNTGEVVATGIYYETVEWKPGTLVPEGVDHVGMYIGDGKLIHASRSNGGVAIEDMDAAKNFGRRIVGYRRMCDLESERYIVSIPDSLAPYQNHDKFLDLVRNLSAVDGVTLVSHKTPYYSQLTDIGGDFWPTRACGSTALAMAMAHFDRYVGGKSGLLAFCDENRDRGAYIYPLGWFRNKLAAIAREDGLSAELRNSMSAGDLANEIAGGSLALLSIEKKILGRKRAHIVLAVGVIASSSGDPVAFLIHDPESTSEEFGAYQYVTTSDLLVDWTLAAVIIGK